MPYAVSFDDKDGIVYVTISGPAVKDDHYAARDKAFQLCQDNACSRLLVDLRDLDAKAYSIMGCFTFGEALAKSPLHLLIAHVLPVDAKSAAHVIFTSTIEANRGKSTGEFKTIEEAIQWLLGNR
jgi:hypothetical protein